MILVLYVNILNKKRKSSKPAAQNPGFKALYDDFIATLNDLNGQKMLLIQNMITAPQNIFPRTFINYTISVYACINSLKTKSLLKTSHS